MWGCAPHARGEGPAPSNEVEQRFESFWQSLGFSVDWRLRYSTISPAAQRMSQWSFLDLHRKGRVYRATAPNPWCIECRTAIAQAEVDDIERETTFYTLAFRLADSDGGRWTVNGSSSANNTPQPDDNETAPTVHRPLSTVQIATTRPELLPACVAIFVHHDDGRYAALVGAEAIVPLFERRVPILADQAVDPAKGSGAVMCCTFGDATDVAWWKDHRLPLIALLNKAGRLSAHGGPYADLSLGQARQRIIADLAANGVLLGQRPAHQSVRVHERCGTPLEILETEQWYIRLLDVKEELLAAGRQISWRPAYMLARYERWVENLNLDWCISRQRFYGVPFPAWHCEQCGAGRGEASASADALPQPATLSHGPAAPGPRYYPHLGLLHDRKIIFPFWQAALDHRHGFWPRPRPIRR